MMIVLSWASMLQAQTSPSPVPPTSQAAPNRSVDRTQELLDLMGIPREGRPVTTQQLRRATNRTPSPVAPTQTPEQIAQMRLRQSSCFATGRGDLDWETRAGAAVVQVLLITPEGNSIGTGTVIRNSANIPGGTNAILTAYHVVEAAVSGEPGTAIGIISSLGEPIGWVEVTARGHTSTRERDRSSAANMFQRGDIAVLRIRGFSSPAAEQSFRAIEGVDISRSLNTTLMVGEISDPAGTNPGISGAAAFDPDGNIYGVVVRRSANNQSAGNWTVRGIRHEGIDPLRRPAHDGNRATRTVLLPQSSTTYVEPLLHPEVLAALGGAATEVQIREGGREAIETMFMGFPSGVCVTYRGRMAPAR